MTEVSLDEWVATVAAELGVDPTGIDVNAVLDLAGVAARAVIRPAAPLTTFLAGLAAGQAGATPESIRAAIETANAVCEAQGA